MVRRISRRKLQPLAKKNFRPNGDQFSDFGRGAFVVGILRHVLSILWHSLKIFLSFFGCYAIILVDAFGGILVVSWWAFGLFLVISYLQLFESIPANLGKTTFQLTDIFGKALNHQLVSHSGRFHVVFLIFIRFVLLDFAHFG